MSSRYYYTGVGSRHTPPNIRQAMGTIARDFNKSGWWLRSGGAVGADSAFESCAGRRAEIYLPWKGFRGHPSPLYHTLTGALDIAREIHLNWKACSLPVRKLHARNIHQVLGHDLNSPSECVVCWTPNGKAVGGTRTAIVCAEMHDILVFNLALGPWYSMNEFILSVENRSK